MLKRTLTIAAFIFSQGAFAGNTINCGELKLVSEGSQAVVIGSQSFNYSVVHAESSDGRRLSVSSAITREIQFWRIAGYPQVGQSSSIEVADEASDSSSDHFVRTARLYLPGASRDILCKYE
jgi:hypothetical protein